MQSTKYFSCLTLTCLAVLVFYASLAMACVCDRTHPQDVFCKADYVVFAQVLIKYVGSYQMSYKLNIRYPFKLTAEGNKTLENRVLLTGFELDSCSVHLEKGESYVIAGSGSELNHCTYIKKFRDMPPSHLIGFSGGYTTRQACRCQTSACDRNTTDISDKCCAYSSDRKCVWYEMVSTEQKLVEDCTCK